MIARWEQGRETVDQLIEEERLQKVSPSRELADLMVARARTHLGTAAAVAAADPVAAFQTAYDAARKALMAILTNQGLRPTSTPGSHAVLLEACMAQLDPPLGGSLLHFDWLRRTRNGAEYPELDAPEISKEDVADAVRLATGIVDVADQVLDAMPRY
ncbi:MAG: HEPN domain-containing protein [Bifidobacteriaceae bacterium]|jgi:hypothetical protein|nr:HEPN domain-containing protein [Bifidobacteriaceae bacterium]